MADLFLLVHQVIRKLKVNLQSPSNGPYAGHSKPNFLWHEELPDFLVFDVNLEVGVSIFTLRPYENKTFGTTLVTVPAFYRDLPEGSG